MVFVQLINVVCNQNATQCSSSQLVVVTYIWCNRTRIDSIHFIYQKRIELLQFVKNNFIIISLFEFNFSFDAIVKKLLLVYIHIICHMDFALGIKLSKKHLNCYLETRINLRFDIIFWPFNILQSKNKVVSVCAVLNFKFRIILR